MCYQCKTGHRSQENAADNSDNRDPEGICMTDVPALGFEQPSRPQLGLPPRLGCNTELDFCTRSTCPVNLACTLVCHISHVWGRYLHNMCTNSRRLKRSWKHTLPKHDTASNTNEINPMTHTWIHSIKGLWTYPGAYAHSTPARIAISPLHSTASVYL